MIQLIVGNEGRGKTGKLLEKINADVINAKGNYVYLDKNTKHMYELNNKIRLINVSDFTINSESEFYGFVCGILSQDHDIELMSFDNFLSISNCTNDPIEAVLNKFNELSEAFKIDFIISIALSESDIPDSFKSKIIVSL